MRVPPFLELSSGQSAHLYQLFVERDESLELPTVQQLFEQSFMTSNVKLKKVPSVLVLQMPRFGRQFKVYDRILPSEKLDVTNIIENCERDRFPGLATVVFNRSQFSALKQCTVCGKLATNECVQCYGQLEGGMDGMNYCEECVLTSHSHQKRRDHKWNHLTIPEEYWAAR